MLTVLAGPNRTKWYELEWVLNKNFESFPFAIFSKLLNVIEIDLKVTISVKIFFFNGVNISNILRGLIARKRRHGDLKK